MLVGRLSLTCWNYATTKCVLTKVTPFYCTSKQPGIQAMLVMDKSPQISVH